MAFSGQSASSHAGGKVILVGEHAVVHGVEAVAAGISVGARATVSRAATPQGCLSISSPGTASRELVSGDLINAKNAVLKMLNVADGIDLSLHVEVASGAGLGSSASMGVAFVRALCAWLDLRMDAAQTYELAMHWERVFHGNPSGVDVAASAHGGWIGFSRSKGVSFLPSLSPLTLCIGHSGQSASTRKMVEMVAHRREQSRAAVDSIFDQIGCLARQSLDELQSRNLDALGEVMNSNHRLLRELGLSTSGIESLCSAALKAGAVGAKLTGSGGGGCVIALAPGKESDVIAAWSALGFDAFVAEAGVAERNP